MTQLIKYLMVLITILLLIGCGEDATSDSDPDPEPEIIETIKPLPSQNGFVVNSAGETVHSESYRFQFVVGMNQTVASSSKKKRYQFRFIGSDGIAIPVNQAVNNRNYSFRFGE